MPMIEAGRSVLRKLQAHGHEAYFVGGYVRDTLLGRSTHDIDIATSAEPAEVMSVFARVAPTGLKHGTVTVIQDGFTFEVTTFRHEGTYTDYRRPEDVRFVKELGEDLRRRDFTMNAMAMTERGEIIDPYGGQEDVAKGRLRCVGQAWERFEEDALRMLRCIRFASEYDLSIETLTWEALLQHAGLLKHIALERIRTELEKMLEGRHPSHALGLLHRSELLNYAKKPIALPLDKHKALFEAGSNSRLELLSEPIQRWAWLLYRLGFAADAAGSLMRRLTFSSAKLTAIADRMRMLEELEAENPGMDDPLAVKHEWQELTLRYGLETAKDVLTLLTTYPSELNGSGCRSVCQYGSDWIDDMQVHALSELAVSGSDLLMLQHDRKAGPWLGELLQLLLREAAFGRVSNTRAELLACAASWLETTISEEQKR